MTEPGDIESQVIRAYERSQRRAQVAAFVALFVLAIAFFWVAEQLAYWLFAPIASVFFALSVALLLSYWAEVAGASSRTRAAILTLGFAVAFLLTLGRLPLARSRSNPTLRS